MRKVKPFGAAFKQRAVYFRCMENNRILQGVLGLLLGYNVVFFAAHIQGEARALAEVLSEVQSLLNIFELIAVMVLFVDLVLRFDHIAKNWQAPRVAAVAADSTRPASQRRRRRDARANGRLLRGGAPGCLGRSP